MRSVTVRGLALLAGCLAMSAVAQTPYKVVDHWKIGGTGGWDYLLADPGAKLLYVTHGPRVEVIDTKTGKLVTSISGLKGTHGVALDPKGDVGYISDGGANEVVVFDRKSFAKVASVPAGTNPDGIAFEPKTRTVWAFNGRSNNATVIDADKRTVVATIPLPGKPEFPQVDGAGNVYVNIENKNSIVKLDAVKKEAVGTWALPGCDSPSGMVIDKEHMRLFSVCDGKKMPVTDAKTGKQLFLASIGDGPDATNYDAKDQLVFSSNGGDGTLTVTDAKNGYKLLETLPTAKGARTMAYDPETDRAYLSAAKYGPLPAPTEAVPHPRPQALPDSFEIIVVGR